MRNQLAFAAVILCGVGGGASGAIADSCAGRVTVTGILASKWSVPHQGWTQADVRSSKPCEIDIVEVSPPRSTGCVPGASFTATGTADVTIIGTVLTAQSLQCF